jgi:hypothetical protein
MGTQPTKFGVNKVSHTIDTVPDCYSGQNLRDSLSKTNKYDEGNSAGAQMQQ